MNKIEFYNKLVEVYKKTGRGVPKFIADRSGAFIFEDLKNDGLVKLVVKTYSYLPSDETICLTKGYCVEEDMKDNDTSALTFINFYKKNDPIVDLGVHKLYMKDAAQNEEFMSKYNVWLNKNKEQLEEGDNIQLLDESSFNVSELNDETIEYLKTRSWFKENLTVSECLSEMTEGDRNRNKQIQILTQLIALLNHPSVKDKYKEDLEKNIKEKEELENDEKYRKSIRRWLNNNDGNKKIQSLI